MRFLGIGDYCDLGALYLRLIEEGHEVRISIANPLCRGTLAGMVEQTPDWQDELDWIRAAGADGVILFENVADNRGTRQDGLRSRGFNVIGGSGYGDRLENDRAYAQRMLAAAGLSIARTWEFAERRWHSISSGEPRPLRPEVQRSGCRHRQLRRPAARWSRPQRVPARACKSEIQGSGLRADGACRWHRDGCRRLFRRQQILAPACLDWEHKRFFPGDLGELTGEMGTVVTYDRSSHFFARTLGRMEQLLRDHGHCGYVNLNTIVNEHGIWPLEFTCRFGYPGFAILTPLQETPWGELLAAMVRGSLSSFEARPGFCVGIVLTSPPFPYPRSQVPEPVGLPVLFDGELTADDHRNLHYCEVGLGTVSSSPAGCTAGRW